MKPAEKNFLFILILALLLLLGCFRYKLIVNNYEYDSFTDVEIDITTIARGEQQEEFKLTGADQKHGSSENQIEGETDLFQIDFEKLQEINPDVKGWLIIPAADVDHVVVQGTDNEYYVHRNLYEEYQYSGTIFIDHRWTEEKSRNLLIYGHNMSNDTMLGQLECYLDPEVCNEFPYFWYVTPDEVYRCDLVSVYITDIYDNYTQTDFLAETGFLEFVDQILYKSYYDFGLTVEAEDKVFSISTCYMIGSDQRLSIHAVMHSED